MSFTSGQILTASQLNTFDPSTKITNATGSNSAPSYTFNSDEDTGMFRSAADEIAFATGGTQRLTIKSDGDVGIGTSNPSVPLHVATGGGDHGILVQSTDSVARINMQDDSSTDAFAVGVGATGDALSLFAGSAERIRIESDGDVGIGTTTPNAPLEVFHSTTDTVARFGSGDSGGFISFYDNDSANDFHQRIGADQDALLLQTAATNRIVIASDGDVGIGTNSPSARLHVDSGATNLGLLVESTDAGAIIGLKDNSTSGTSHVGIRATGDKLILRSNNLNQVTIDTDGSIQAQDGSASAPTFTFSDTNTGMYRSGDDQVAFTAGGVLNFQILNNGVFVPSGSNYFGVPSTGTGNDAEWASTGFGTFLLQRNSSLTAEKENITADLGTHLTADMIDSVVPKLWNRTNAPGYPEIGPLAEDMDAISPFLAAHGADIQDGTYQEFLTGINKTAYLSLLVLAVKDLRTRVAALESA